MKYKREFDKHVTPHLKSKTIEEYSEMDCREFRDCIDSSGLSTGVKNSVLNGFKSVFTHAVKYYGLKDTPARHLEPFKKNFKEGFRK